MNILLLFSAPCAGHMRDVLQTYTIAFLIWAGMKFLGGVLLLMAKKPVLAGAPQRSQIAQRVA